MGARSKAGHSLAGIASSNPAGGGDGCLSFVDIVSCQVEVPATGLSLVQKSRIECGVSGCKSNASTIIRRTGLTKDCHAVGEKCLLINHYNCCQQ